MWVVVRPENRSMYRCRKCGGVRANVIHEFIDRWLVEVVEQHKQLVEVNHNLERIEKLAGAVFSMDEGGLLFKFMNAGQELWDYIKQHDTALVSQHEERLQYALENPFEKVELAQVDALYQEVWNKQHEQEQSQLDALRNRHSVIIDAMLDSGRTKDSEWIEKENAIKQEIFSLEKLLANNLVVTYRAIKDEMNNLTSLAIKLRADLHTAEGTQKEELLLDILKEVRVSFDSTRKKSVRRLIKAEIVGHNGCGKRVFSESECQAACKKCDRRGDNLWKNMAAALAQRKP